VHGSLFDVKCTGFYCDYLDRDNFTDPIVPALAIPRGSPDLTSNEARETAGYGEGAAIDHSRELDISNENVYLPELSRSDLPRCPKCKEGYLRPGVVWFGEALPADVLDEIDDWIDESEAIDLMLVIGTSAEVFPAAEYVDMAREKGARIAVVNTEPGDARKLRLTDRDWYFQGDASSIVPCILESVIGPVADVE
jgi:NAD+-dependent protein deacetylase sirtuin 5